MNTVIPEEIDYQQLKANIYIKGASSNNLKNIDLVIPKNKLIVVTGLSGSGKSSLVMDTLYAEGQRRYVESLSSYARQFLSRMKKPDVEYIKGISPAIAIEQRVTSSNARSTVGSLTEINDYLRLLYARIGKTISPISGEQVKKHEVADVVDYIMGLKEGSKIMLFSPLIEEYDRSIGVELNLLLQKGYNRISMNGEISYIEDVINANDDTFLNTPLKDSDDKILLLIDRFIVKKKDEENTKRIADSILTAFQESHGECLLELGDGTTQSFNNRFELDGIVFIEPTHQLFNYNNPYGACPQCEGYGKVLGIDADKIIPDDSKSVFDNAVACWSGEKSSKWRDRFIVYSQAYDFPIHRPINRLNEEQLDLLWNGKGRVRGIEDFFDDLKSQTYKIQNRVILARYRGKTNCPSCNGERLRKEASYVKVGGRSIGGLMDIPLEELLQFITELKLDRNDEKIADRILYEIRNRLEVMNDIGLSYLHLDREASTLSGGETQRINLTRILGSNLTNSMYILDEPSIGLHPNDTDKLVEVLKRLRDLKNTVIVVEHEEEVIKAADYVLDIGPLAGSHGGELVFAGTLKDLKKADSLTAQYISGKQSLAVPEHRRKPINKITIHNARQHNLKGIDVTIPLNALTVLSGVSGSGKTTLIKHILYPGLAKAIGDPISKAPGKFEKITGDLSTIKQVELINQNPLGRSSRSNPVTYVKAYDGIRKLYAGQQLSKIRGYKPKHFSFNVEGGRCETCKGDGEQIVEMQFLSDVRLICEECHGKRFKKEVLEVVYQDKNIYDILDMTIEDAMEFFKEHKDIINKIQPLFDVGLGYIKLGQSSSTLSGGEAQRVKLSSYLNKESKSKGIFFIFDEPTTGLHFHDVSKLMAALNGLVENGHTVLVIEHNMDVIKSADWLIDLGPEGGNHGGELIYQGTPEGILAEDRSLTAKFLKDKL